MVEWIVSSSVLILVVSALRFLLRGRISLRLQYALWALVLLRLLVPFSFGESRFSVMNAVTVNQTEYYVWFAGDLGAAQVEPDMSGETMIPPVSTDTPNISVGPYTGDIPANTALILFDRIILGLWLTGIAITAFILLFSNLRFARQVKRSRQRVDLDAAPLPVFLSEVVDTPCLFGLFRPAIYITPEVLADQRALRHVLAHETTHYRHRDHIWALLRCLCLALHWYNPLVWMAVCLSGRDGELACDESTIRYIGEARRAEYGRTLIALTCTKRGAILSAATTMTGSKRSIKERIALIAQRPKMKIYTFIVVILIAVFAVGCTFTDGGEDYPWTWANNLSVEDVDEAAFWHDFSEYKLTAGETEELVSLINKLNRLDFKENSRLVGPTPTYGMSLVCGENRYSINELGTSRVEMHYNGKQWWITDNKLTEFLDSLLALYPDNKTGSTEIPLISHEPEDDIMLTEDEIARVNEAFTPFLELSEGVLTTNPICCLFTSYYEDPRQLDLAKFLAYFPYSEPGSEEEFDALKTMENGINVSAEDLEDMPVPLHRIKEQTINDVLWQYAGVTLAELEDAENSRNGLYYLEEYDAYYNFTSDAGGGVFHCVGGRIQEESVILYSEHSKLVLIPQDERYVISSFQPIEGLEN